MKTLPDDKQDQILIGFLFWDFVTTFMRFFKIKKPVDESIKSIPSIFSVMKYQVYYTWWDQPYQ